MAMSLSQCKEMMSQFNDGRKLKLSLDVRPAPVYTSQWTYYFTMLQHFRVPFCHAFKIRTVFFHTLTFPFKESLLNLSFQEVGNN